MLKENSWDRDHHSSRVFELCVLPVAFQFQQHAMRGRFSMT